MATLRDRAAGAAGAARSAPERGIRGARHLPEPVPEMTNSEAAQKPEAPSQYQARAHRVRMPAAARLSGLFGMNHEVAQTQRCM